MDENLKNRCRHFFVSAHNGRIATICIALIFSFALFIQCCLCYWFTDGVSFLVNIIHPTIILPCYPQKVAISLFFASFVFLFKRKYWTLYVLIVHALWILAECIYLQSFHTYIDAFALSMVGNLEGFTASILMYLQPRYLLLLIPILLMVAGIILFNNRQSADWKLWMIGIGIAMILHVGHSVYMKNLQNKYMANLTMSDVLNPMTLKTVETSSPQYLAWYSSVHAFFRVAYEMIAFPEDPIDTEELTECMQSYVQPMSEKPIPKAKLLIILIESLENWAILPSITPNICHYLDTHPLLYASKIACQTKKGGSMDGQILINTGLLPIKKGASCYRFPANRYPSISELYTNSAIITPGGPSIWNQGAICKACEIDSIYDVSFDDDAVIKKYLQVAAMHDYAILVTVSSHSPFQKGAEQSHLQLPPMMPELMQQYLKSINYMDSCIGDVLQKLDSDSMFDSTIVVLTGDHTIFSKNFRDEFSAYCSMSGDTIYRVNEAFVPFVLGGKPIKKPIYVTERAYQMDIYPTIMHAIGCETFFWKGWGVNLMDSTMRENRIITSSEAFELADKVIRSNWFEKCCSQGNYK